MSDSDIFSEVDCNSEDTQLSQGDIIHWIEGGGVHWQNYGVIITADCDLDKRKHKGIVSYVPVMTTRQYLSLYILPEKLESHKRVYIDKLKFIVNKYRMKNLPEFPNPVSEDMVYFWLKNTSPDEVVSDLLIQKPADIISLRQCFDKIREIDGISESMDFSDLYSCHLSCSPGPEPRSQIEKLVRELLTSPPGDIFFIGKIEGDSDDGFIAYLRLVREINESEIAVKFSDLRESGIKVKRVGKLRSPYLYSLTQKLGSVFSSIGLPDNYENNRKLKLATILPHELQGRGQE